MGNASGQPRTHLNHIWLGSDRREVAAHHVACHTLGQHAKAAGVQIHSLHRQALMERGLYKRPTNYIDGALWDVISGAAMSTEHAISRFLVPHLARRDGIRWALFMDCDVLVRDDISKLFDHADRRYAVMVVKHDSHTVDATKMDKQAQLPYARKWWSSVMLFNAEHPANERLTLDKINTFPGRDLHRFCWLTDDEIGELPARWNHLVGIDPHDPDTAVAHMTLGTPDMPGYENSPFADEWRSALEAARAHYKTYTAG